jgi:hypothetical protein
MHNANCKYYPIDLLFGLTLSLIHRTRRIRHQKGLHKEIPESGNIHFRRQVHVLRSSSHVVDVTNGLATG